MKNAVRAVLITWTCATLTAAYTNCGLNRLEGRARSKNTATSSSSAQTSVSAASESEVELPPGTASGRWLSSSENGYTYGYSPNIVYEDGVYHLFYCSTGTGVAGDWDRIRYSTSSNGTDWSIPRIVLRAHNSTQERAACNPSVIKHSGTAGTFYYLFYSGSDSASQAVTYMARADHLSGPWMKLTQRNTWEEIPGDPKIVIAPKNPVSDSWLQANTSSAYKGARQPTVVNRDGTLYMWYTDDTIDFPNQVKNRILLTTSTDAINWSTPVATDVENLASVDVKFNPLRNRFEMLTLSGANTSSPRLGKRFSTNGTNWSNEYVLCDSRCIPAYAHNPGWSGDVFGTLAENRTFVGFGAPYNLANELSWARWDLFGFMMDTSIDGRPIDRQPIGYIDGSGDSRRTVLGWAYDPDEPSRSIQVHVYVNGPAGQGRGFVITADQSRDDVNRALSIEGKHGFAFTLPDEFHAGNHQLYFYAIDSTGKADNVLIQNGPFLLALPVASE